MRFGQHLVASLLLGVWASGCQDAGTEAVDAEVAANATSRLCDDLTGFEAVYWDFSNGVPRGDLPSTAFTIPSDFTNVFAHPTVLSFYFWYPQDWYTDTVIDDGAGSYGGVLVRDDNLAVWRSATGNVAAGTTATALLQSEITTMLDFVGNPADVETVCTFDVSQPNFAGGTTEVASEFVRAGEFTANINVQIDTVPLGGGSSLSQASVKLVVGPTAEHSSLVADVYVPIITQFYQGGSATYACSDGVDNDGDGKIDFPEDTECRSSTDDSEADL